MPPNKNRHVKPPAFPAPTGKIPAAAVPVAGDILLSFKHYDFSGKFMCANQCKADLQYMDTTLARLKHICGAKLSELKASGKTWRCHPIKFSETTEPNGFSTLPAHLQDNEPMQIGLETGDGRIHGVFSGNIFYLVWFDADHRLYQRK